jgi:PKD repeat protein
VTLTVTDDLGKKSIFIQTIVVNGLPKAIIDADPEVQVIDEPITFTAERSMDPDGTIASFLWDFGDGNGSTLAAPTHIYSSVDSYLVTLTVTDNRGTQAQDTRFVRIVNRNYEVNFTLQGEDIENRREWTSEGGTTHDNVTLDVENLHLVRFHLIWRDNYKPIGGPANDLFRITVVPPAGSPMSANGTSENLTLIFPMASIPMNRTWEGRDAEDVRQAVTEQLGSTMGMGVWAVQIEAIECNGAFDRDEIWFDDPGNLWTLAVHYEYFSIRVTEL